MSSLTTLLNFSSKPMIERWAALLKASELYIATVQKDLGQKANLGIDHAALYHVHVSTYYDIHRYKMMHLEDPNRDLSDSIKRVAYYTKWLIKMRPFWIHRKNYKPSGTDRGVFLNEDFALRWANSNLSFELDKAMPPLTNKKYSELLYNLHYRDVSSDSLIYIFQNMYDIASGEKILHGI